jgi:isoamylase
VHFQIASEHATVVELCLFSELETVSPVATVALDRGPEDTWHTYVPNLLPGQLYGYRVDGPWAPTEGHWFNPAKLLLDPAALAVVGNLQWDPALSVAVDEQGQLHADPSDSAAFVPRSMVIDRRFDWQGISPPGRSWNETLIYECHVKGMTQLHPGVPEEHRGTYSGLAHDAIIEHLLSLGVTAVELLPVQQSLSEHHLQDLGLTNYFGYNPIAFFAPHVTYSSDRDGGQVGEFKTMVRKFHGAGIEVLLDVVFNHTAEGSPMGPTLSLRGLDNRSFYRLDEHQAMLYQDFSGCGNTLDFGKPLVTRLVLNCLRYWVEEMHVDGFRFDLATVLGRSGVDFDPQGKFLNSLAHDPVLARAKLIAEPWDVGPHGYKLGEFPPDWAEWNDRFRDGARSFWRGDRGVSQELAYRLLGSPDIFKSPNRSPDSSINFTTCHDGFTLEDLVSFEHKHNLANGEENRDGHNHNLSRNWGVEGPTSSAEITALRARAKRNLLATVALSEGVPMLSHGDELGRSQMGNNNAYCQDNELTWASWDLDADQQEFLEFSQGVLRLRASLGLANSSEGSKVSTKLISAHAEPMTNADWRHGRQPVFGVFRTRPESAWLLIVNNDTRGHLFELPQQNSPGKWTRLLDTSRQGRRRILGQAIRVSAYSLVVVRFSPSTAGLS